MKCIAQIFLFSFVSSYVIAQVTFTESSIEMGLNHYYLSPNLMGGGVAFFDYNNDGWDDVWLNGGSVPDKLFLNKQDGTFEDVSGPAGLFNGLLLGSTSVITGDINNDGHRDVFITTGNNKPNRILLNDGQGQFNDISETAGIINDIYWTTSAAFGDINLDGYLDIYTGNYMEEASLIYDNGQIVGFDHTCMTDNIYLNNGDLTFQKLDSVFWTNQTGCVLASTFTDYDLDGDADLMIANDFGEWIVPNRLFNNDFPNLSMTEVGDNIGANPGVYAMGIATGDYDLDQDLDYYITNLGRNVLLNNNQLQFADITTEAGVEDTQFNGSNTVGWGTAFEDIDLDMYPDLLVSNGHIDAAEFIATNQANPNKMYLNNQDGTFEDISVASGFADAKRGRGLACSDIDNDGDIDIFIMNITGLVIPGNEANIALYKTELNNQNNWIKVNLEGTKNNRDGYGSIVRCYVNNEILIRELSGGSSHASQNSSTLHFGLAENDAVDSLTVTWPGGKIQSVINPAINQSHHILEDLSLYISNTGEVNNFDFKIFPNPVNDHLFIDTKAPVTEYQIYNALGACIQRGSGKSIKLMQNNPGIYYLKIYTDQGKGQMTFVVP